VVTPVVVSADVQTYPDPMRNATLTFTATNFGSQPTVVVEQAAAPAPVKIFVDAAQADDNGDGLTWATAKKTIQAAVNAAAANRDTVFVKAGTYIISSTLTPAEGVNVYGGFAGTEVSIAERVRANAADAPWSFSNATILDANHTPTRILKSANFNTVTTWDGFTFQNAKDVNLTDNGGAAAFLSKNMILNNCILQNNSTTNNKGGGAVLMNRDAGLRNSLIQNNTSAGDGGGIFFRDGTTSGDQVPVTGCHIIGNTSKGSNGGAIANYFSSGTGSYKVSGCYIASNVSTGNAAAIFSNSGGTSAMIVEDCVLTENTSTGNAPAVARGNAGLFMNRCLIVNNKFTREANTGIVFFNNRGAIYNSVIANNTMPGTQGNALHLNAASAVAINNTIVNNASNDVTGNAAAIFKNNILYGNSVSTSYSPTGAEGNVRSGLAFRDTTTFKGVAANAEQVRQIFATDWRLAENTDGVNLTSGLGSIEQGDCLLKDANKLDRPVTGSWTVGAYSYVASLMPNVISWTQQLSLDMNGVGSPKEMVLNATAAASGSVQYIVDDKQVATIENGNILKSFAPGATVVRAVHYGDATHAVAAEVVKNLTVSGDPSTLTLSASTLNLAKAGGSQNTITLSSNYGFSVTRCPLWITVNPNLISEPSADRVITFTAVTNPAIVERQDTVEFLSGGLKKQLVVTQEAGDPALSASPTSVTLSALVGASGTFNITSNTAWSIVGKPSWATLSATSGTGNATITVTVAEENTDQSNSRTATLTISADGLNDVVVSVEQSRALPADIIYVAKNGSGTDGSTWATAFTNIADALSAASIGNKIFVKADTYNVVAAFQSKAGVRLYGGFAGTEVGDGAENTRVKGASGNAWDFMNVTVLKPDSSVRVIAPTELDIPATWDGFTMLGARHVLRETADSSCNGGVAYLRKNTFLNACVITDNVTLAGGGGIFMEVDARIYNSLISNNVSLNGNGGAINIAPIESNGNYIPLVGNSIVDNKAIQGGGLSATFGTDRVKVFEGTMTIFNNSFIRNISTVLNGGGGGIAYNIDAVCTIITDSCTFDSNEKITNHPSGGSPGGGAVRTQGSGGTAVFNRSIFTNNKTIDTRGGSALHTNSNSHKMRIYNCLIKDNKGGAEAVQLRAGSHIINSTILGNDGNGIGFTDGVICNNIVWGNGADLNPSVVTEPSNVGKVTFVDSAAGDFRIAIHDNAVDKGVIINYQTDPVGVEMLKTDFAGTPRPQGASYDPGMYEYIKAKPTNVIVTWNDDLSNLGVNQGVVKLTATVDGASPSEALPYLSPVAFYSDDDLTASIVGDTLVLMGAGTTNITAHTNVNPFYDTVSLVKVINVVGTDYLGVLPTNINLGMYEADSAASFKMNTDKAWTITGIPAWVELTDTLGAAGRGEIFINIKENNHLSLPRSAIMTISTGTKSREIVLNQEGLIFSVSTTNLDMTRFADEKSFNLSANLQWIVDIDVDWLTTAPNSGNSSRLIRVTSTPNLDEERTGIITISAERPGVDPLTIAVVQAGVEAPPVTSAEKEQLTALIYPNPTSGVLNVILTEDLDNAELQIFSLTGTMVYTQAWSGRSQSIDISRLGNGLYFMALRSADGKVINAKISKQ
jgi:hypothetical protein